MNKLFAQLNKPVDAINLVAFRFGFGIILFIQLVEYFQAGFVNELIHAPKLNFGYLGLTFITRINPMAMQLMLLTAMAGALAIALGKWHKPASIITFVIYTYFFLLEKSLYNNHIYLIANLLFVFIFLHPVININYEKSKVNSVSYWQVALLQFFIVLTYFYGGIAKINPDWFNGEPVTSWLFASKFNFLHNYFAVQFFTWTGLFFDLLVGFAFFIKPLRSIAFISAIVFNISNAILFNDISIFPFFMLWSLLLFVEPSFIRTKLKFLVNILSWFNPKKNEDKLTLAAFPKWILVFLAFHLLFPFRQFFYKGRADWTGKAQFFSWHMKSQHREVDMLQLYFHHPQTNEKIAVPMRDYLIYEQWYTMAYHPEMLVQFAHFLEKDLKKKAGFNEVKITADCRVKFNGKSSHHVVDTNLNLVKIKLDVLAPNNWVLPEPKQ